MAISVQTDLVLDVLKAANSSDIAAANAKLKANSAVEIAAAGQAFGAELSNIAAIADKADLSNLRDSMTGSPDKLETYKKFESVILEQFVKYMLPEDTNVIFGEGTAGEIWKGMMAQQLGDTIAKSGGIGIAEQMMAKDAQASINQASNIIFRQERDVIDSLDENPNS